MNRKILGLFLLLIVAMPSVVFGLTIWEGKEQNNNPKITIKMLLDNPRYYEKQEVKITGIVMRKIGFVIRNTYLISDKTGAIRIFTKKAMPKVGEEITVIGEFKEAFSLAGWSYPVIIEKE
jgi:hypothetical protein